MNMLHAQLDAVHRFWFGEIEDQFPVEPRYNLWFKLNVETDALIRAQFATMLRRAVIGEFDETFNEPKHRLSAIVLLDQFTRNMFRGRPEAFACDEIVLSWTLEGLDEGQDRQLSLIERCFFYLPLEHSENLEHQERCVSLFKEMNASAKPAHQEALKSSIDYAQLHYDIIKRFGRFPHRNAVLKRESTPEEQKYLLAGAARFNQ